VRSINNHDNGLWLTLSAVYETEGRTFESYRARSCLIGSWGPQPQEQVLGSLREPAATAGRLALGVLDVGLFAGTRLIELADLVLATEDESAAVEEPGS